MSSFTKVSNSSGSDADGSNVVIIDEKKRKRMISNRESARRSRMRRQKHMEDLINEKGSLEKKLREDNQKYFALWQKHLLVESENKVLRSETRSLEHYLRNLHQILENCKGPADMESEDINLEVSEQYLNPWQVGGPAQSITASAGMFKI